MPTFHGTLRLVAEPDSVMAATVIIVDDRFILQAAGMDLGDWALHDVEFKEAGEDFRLAVDTEEAILSIPERGAFAAAVGIGDGMPEAPPSPPEAPAGRI